MLMAASSVAPSHIKNEVIGKNQHVVNTNNGWGVLGENNSRITQNFSTQKEAIAKARTIANNQNCSSITGKEEFVKGQLWQCPLSTKRITK